MSSTSIAEIDRPLLDVREERNFRALLARQSMVRPAHENVGLDADRAQLLDGMLRGLRLDLRRCRHERHERQMYVERALAAELDAQLPDRLQERQRLDVADRAADLHHANVGAVGAAHDALLDLVGDVRNDLHRRAEILAAPLLCNHVRVDPPGREITVPARAGAHEALVVAESRSVSVPSSVT